MAWRVNCLRDVAGNQRPSHGLLEGLVQCGMDYLDGPGGEPGLQLLTVQRLDLEGIQPVELGTSEHRLQVYAYDLFVSLPGSLPYRSPHSVEPPVEVLAHGHVLRVVHDPGIPIGYGFGQLACDFLLILPPNVLALDLALRHLHF